MRTDDDATFDTEVTLDATTVAFNHLPKRGGPKGCSIRVVLGGRLPARRRAGAVLHGSDGRNADARHHRGHRLPRLLHQRADGGPARGSGRQRPSVAPAARARVVPGRCRRAAGGKQEGLTRVSRAGAAAQWLPMCLGMTPTRRTGERSASTPTPLEWVGRAVAVARHSCHLLCDSVVGTFCGADGFGRAAITRRSRPHGSVPPRRRMSTIILGQIIPSDG